MRGETVIILNMVDAWPGLGREAFLADLEPLIMQKKYFSTEELSARYGVTIQTLKNWENAGELVPDLRVGKGCVRYSAAVVADFEKKHPGKGA